MALNDRPNKSPVAISAGDELARTLNVVEVQYQVVDDDVWLQAGYDLLASGFDAAVLDPIERYKDWIRRNREGTHAFPFMMALAYVVVEGRPVVIGVIAGNLMRGPHAEGQSKQRWFFAVGHQLTPDGFRGSGVGRKLWNFAIDTMKAWAEQRGGVLWGSVLESEVDSVGYWSRIGYRWPQGLRYWQPPLVFDAEGAPQTPEVPEIFMLQVFEPRDPETVSKATVFDVIRTMYECWCIDKYTEILSPAALDRARGHVFGQVFARVQQKAPAQDELRLVAIDLSKADADTKSFRSIALNSGAQHDLEPLRARRPSEVTSFASLLEAMKGMAFGARTLGDAADVLYAMATESGCRVVLTMAGAVTIAKLDLFVAELIERGIVHGVVSTGAIICHGFNSERGSPHFRVPADKTDTWLFEQGYNRIFDTVETEFALDELQDIFHDELERWPVEQTICSSDIVRLLGKRLVEKGLPDGLLQAAYRKNVPIFVPAFTDSELGLDFGIFNHYRREEGRPQVRFDPFLDFDRYCAFIRQGSSRGIITLGGGVPRNWAQQIGPYLDAIERYEHAIAIDSVRFKYGVRICPDPAYWGGLSGCTYSEGVSWGKFVPSAEGGRVAEVLSDFTFVLPLLVMGLLERLDSRT